MKLLLVQGATGSIGRSVRDIAREQAAQVKIVGLAANSNVDELLSAATEFGVESVALRDESQATRLRTQAASLGIREVFVGADAAEQQAATVHYDILVNAMMGGAGLAPTFAAIRRGKRVALANKETLVAAGALVMSEARKTGSEVIPIDSEHSAILQCLSGESVERIRTIWLTTSGGPFWGQAWASLRDVTPERALAHPTWKMGPKITIDSATLFNKGLEVIEAQALFGVNPEQIRVVAHRQSVIHSMVEYVDGSFKAQLSVPDMRLPILYALSYPDRYVSTQVATDISTMSALTFAPVQAGMFPPLDLAMEALRRGGTAPAALSAADEVAVAAFLQHQISFTAIADVIHEVVDDWPSEPVRTLADVRRADTVARERAQEYVNRVRKDRVRVA